MSITLAPGQTQQFAAQPKDQFSANLFGVGAVRWSVSNPAIGSINQVGLFTAAAAGTITGLVSGTVSATLQGVTGSSTVSVDGSEVTFLRQTVTGGDAAILGLHSVLGGVTAPAASLTQWDDLRGSVGFGPSLIKQGGTIALLGTGPSDWYLQTDGSTGSYLKSAASSRYHIAGAGPITLVIVSDSPDGESAPIAGLLSDDFNNSLLIQSWSDHTQAGGGGSGSTAVVGARAGGARIRMQYEVINGTTIKYGMPLEAPVTGTVNAPAAVDLPLLVAGYTFGSTRARIRAILLIAGDLSSNEAVLESWAQIYHNSVIGGPHFMLQEGDSNTWGQGITGSIRLYQRCSNLLAEDAVFVSFDDLNTGVPSSVFQAGFGGLSLPDRAAATVDVHYDATRQHNILIIGPGMGTNDAAGGRTSDQIVTDYWSYVDARRAVGWKVVGGNMIDRQAPGTPNQAAYDAVRAAANTRIAAEHAAHLDAYYDLWQDARLQDHTNTTYFTDGVHITAAAHAIVKSYQKPAVQSIL